MIYLRAGLYAEGPTDYDFLIRLLTRLIDDVAAALFAGDYELADTLGIDAPLGHKATSRAERIAAAVSANLDLFELLIIHSDGNSDPDAARRSCVDPGIAAVRSTCPQRSLPAVACIPVREIEAWMIKDPQPFLALLGNSATIELPTDPERESDPKATLRRILKEGGARRGPEPIYALFGEQVGLKALRTLPAFQRFETELTAAIREVGRAQGQRSALTDSQPPLPGG